MLSKHKEVQINVYTHLLSHFLLSYTLPYPFPTYTHPSPTSLHPHTPTHALTIKQRLSKDEEIQIFINSQLLEDSEDGYWIHGGDESRKYQTFSEPVGVLGCV